jgi:hypothetical protein
LTGSLAEETKHPSDFRVGSLTVEDVAVIKVATDILQRPIRLSIGKRVRQADLGSLLLA